MNQDSQRYHRRSIRLKGYDYRTPAMYFITIRTYNRNCIFGNINNGRMLLNISGKVVDFTWRDLPNHNPHLRLDEYIIMPDHMHGIIIITKPCIVKADSVGAGSEPAPTTPANKLSFPMIDNRLSIFNRQNPGIPDIIRQFKTFSARRVNDVRKTQGSPVWQRNYYEHIIRNDRTLHRIREYIIWNPCNWCGS